MEEIIQWLMKIEVIANTIYSRASVYFAESPDLNLFLGQSAEDEMDHYDALVSASAHHRSRSQPMDSVAVDETTRRKIEGIFEKISEQIDDRTLSGEAILTHLVNAEFSEWNDIFLYAISYLVEEVEPFGAAARKMQNHLRQVELFVGRSAFGRELLHKLEEIPPVWREEILIVDDEVMVAELIRAVLNRDGRIDIAANGEEGLRKLGEKDYKLVISDIDMPVMDGLTFYRRAVERFPSIASRFIFISGNPSPDTIAFFEENGLAFLRKPAPINRIREKALEVLLT